jgi:hypothetical protein
MKKIRSIFLIVLFSCLMSSTFQAQEVLLLHRAQKAVTTVIVHDIFSPPVASRIYLYTSVAAYEAAIADLSFGKVCSDFHPPARPGQKAQLDSRFSSIYAMLYTASRFVFSDSSMLDSLNAITSSYKQLSPAVKKASIQWAKQVSDSVMTWASKDNYAATRKMKRYSLIKDPAAWIPTPPGYFAAVEPNWGKLRPVVIKAVEDFRPASPIKFGTAKESPFYQQAAEVYEASKKMSSNDSAIASFWDCNPFYLNTQGHLNFATKKLSPGGHWMSIAGVACKKANASFNMSVQAYLFTAVALYDGFISCWDEKYRSNTIRPESYINSYIDQSWRPLLQTPPFPEYTSGHSVISASAASVLTSLFGDDFNFADDTETGYGLPIRHFKSFRDAAEEAAISRFYGGIHYKEAINNGMLQGSKIGGAIVEKMVKPMLKGSARP